jgi:transposase
MRKYDDEFKREALRMIDDGRAGAEVARQLGVGQGLLHKWKSRRLVKASEADKEVIELKRRLRDVEMERDILKKALSIFSRST